MRSDWNLLLHTCSMLAEHATTWLAANSGGWCYIRIVHNVQCCTLHSTPFTLERAPLAVLFSYLLARVGALSRVGTLSRIGPLYFFQMYKTELTTWALFLSNSSGVGALLRVGGVSRLDPLSSVYGSVALHTCKLRAKRT